MRRRATPDGNSFSPVSFFFTPVNSFELTFVTAAIDCVSERGKSVICE